MQTKVAALALCLLAALTSPLGAQGIEPRKVYAGDIMLGYVLEGELVETDGYLWVSSTEVLLNVAALSARAPLFIDVGGISDEAVNKIKAACSAEHPSQAAGCQAVVRGHVAKWHFKGQDRPGIFAISIEITQRP